MLQPQQQLRKLSFDSDLQHVLRTPNRIKYKHNDFEGWQDRQEHPLDSPERKICSYNGQRPKFKVKQSRVRINPESVVRNNNLLIQDKENGLNEKVFNLKMVKMIDRQTLSPNSRKLLTPNKPKPIQSLTSSVFHKTRPYQTPKSTHRTRQNSFHKLSLTQGINKISFTQKRDKYFIQQPEENDQNGYKIPLSAIVYPVLKANNKKILRRIERFHSFVARTVRK